MKVTKLVLKNYLNFQEELTIDLTYPNDHQEKKGQPLDKVCFIGQSCTGKTSLLNLIKYVSFSKEDIDKNSIQEDLLSDGRVEIYYELDHRRFSKKIDKNGVTDFYESGAKQSPEYEKIILGELSKSKPNLINFPFNIIEKADKDKYSVGILSAPASELTTPAKELTLDQRKQLARSRSVWDFSKQDINNLWDIVLDEITIFKKNLDKEKDIFIANVTADENNAKQYVEKLNAWKESNGNPLKKLAVGCLDNILERFNLKAKTELNLDDDDDISFIRLIQSNNQSHVPYQFLSTGVKQVILTALPLFFLKPNNSIILFDQPESSLFPDIQYNLIETYTRLTTNSQFFFATHSPVVASAFEPWEIIELKFDEKNGKVFQVPYYENERKVDNFTKDPRYVRWDTLYMKFFGLMEEGNETFRDRELIRAKRLKSQLEKLKEEGKEKSDEFTSKHKDYLQAAKRLGWDL